MERFFCTTAAKLAHEDPIGTAYLVDTYVLVECPLPWASQAWESPQIPPELRQTIAKITQDPIRQAHSAVKALLIHGDRTRSAPDQRVIIYQRQKRPLSKQFDRYEFVVDRLEDAAAVIQHFFNGIFLRKFLIQSVDDILICTHGSRDQCCARYGNPFYAEAMRIVQGIGTSYQVWRSSHFGGHRFAPTAITFPDGRYYGRLDSFSFNALLRRSGDIQLLRPIYRGSSLLPEPVQELERSLLLDYGWDWLSFPMAAQVRSLAKSPGTGIDPTQPESGVIVQMQWQDRSPGMTHCQAHLVPDLTRTVTLQASCNGDLISTYTKYNLKTIDISRSLAAIAS
jgi:hypothetical protein